jgi:hypothetical protein
MDDVDGPGGYPVDNARLEPGTSPKCRLGEQVLNPGVQSCNSACTNNSIVTQYTQQTMKSKTFTQLYSSACDITGL